jgi:acetylglutamate kinase
MNITDNVRADFLIQALPYIKKYLGKVIIVKFGGAAMVNEGVKMAVMQDLILLSQIGVKVVLVHGGGPEIDATLRKMGKEPVFIKGLRYTDEETMDVVQMVLAGTVNKDIVGIIQKNGGKASGLCGIDGGLFTAKRLIKDGADLGLVGDITDVDPSIIENALRDGFIPVVATIAAGAGEDEKYYNVNADTAAAALALAMKAEKLILLTDVPGILRNVADEGTLITEMHRSELPALITQGIVSKGMIPKLECCATAVENGVKSAHILDGRVPHALLVELLSDKGMGTMIV